MAKSTVTKEQWGELYSLMMQMWEFAPWRYFTAVDVFAVENPHTKEIGFVSVMGEYGEPYWICTYRGLSAFIEYLDTMGRGEESFRFEDLLLIDQLQARFDKAPYLWEDEQAVLKGIGANLNTDAHLPHFRDIRNGFEEIMLADANDADFQKIILEQALFVYERGYKINDNFCRGKEGNSILLRKANSSEGELQWVDDELEIDFTPKAVYLLPDRKLIDEIKGLAKVDMIIEADVFPLLRPAIDERVSRPIYPFVSVIADMKTKLLFDSTIFEPIPDASAVYTAFVEKMLATFKKIEAIPSTVLVRSIRIYNTLLPITTALKIEMKLVKVLPAIEAYKAGLEKHFESV